MADLAAVPFADIDPSFRETSEMPMLLFARPRATLVGI